MPWGIWNMTIHNNPACSWSGLNGREKEGLSRCALEEMMLPSQSYEGRIVAHDLHVGTNSKLRRLAKSKCKTSSSVDRHEFLCGHDGRQKWVYLEGFRVQHPNA